MNRPFALLVLLLLSSLFASAALADVFDASVCEVLANPASFDGRIVRIKGASAIAGFDEFVLEGSGCSPAGAIWLAYPEGTKGKAGPAAVLQLQLAKNTSAVAEAPKRNAVTLDANADFHRFDSLLAAQRTSPLTCLGCPKNRVTATVVGRIDGTKVAGVVRDPAGKLTGLGGFGNLNLYRARLVLQSVSDVVPHEIDYAPAATAVRGDSQRAGAAPASAARRAANAFGAAGEDNGVSVGFGVANVAKDDDAAKGTTESSDGLLYHATFDMDRLGEQLLQKAMTHIGNHIADVHERVAMPTPEDAETRAWKATFTP